MLFLKKSFIGKFQSTFLVCNNTYIRHIETTEEIRNKLNEIDYIVVSIEEIKKYLQQQDFEKIKGIEKNIPLF